MDIELFIKKIGFQTNDNNIYIKEYKQHNHYTIKISIKDNKIYYRNDNKTTQETTPKPDGKILLGDLTTSNFSNPENFVVLELIDKLLEKGYKPENIHLERKWKLGRTGKSGKADINVYKPSNQNKERKTYLIIECKTFGNEFEKEKKRLYKNGGQLFSYYNQDRSADILMLYTSDFVENEIISDSLIIKVTDDEDIITKCKEKNGDKYICSYKDAESSFELLNIWKNLYNQFVFKHGIFEYDTSLYTIELKPLKKKDLIQLTSSQGIFNAFAEILRHNNISDNANAFNKMLSLFLCKIVDEETKKDNDILDFQVKEKETYEDLVDRLQKLYKIGMEKYLGINDFVYFSDSDIHNIVKLYPKRTTIEELEDIFKQIKYYTNNEFAFKEVHNKDLFKQNALILIEIIELIQNYRIKYSHKNQILGDFFELLLNHGVKQSEGQFFTPLPIVKFILTSINYNDFINVKKDNILPKILDFACGAGHFLTESIDEINKIIKIKELNINENWEVSHIYGVEKDYRLARTAKLACFLNGDGSTNIIFGEGLNNHSELHIEKSEFDIIISNPPYAIKNFKNYLELNTKYNLLNDLTENSQEIEVLFIERAYNLLKDKGRIGIILPSSILSTPNGIYIKARKFILEHFEIIGISDFSSKGKVFNATSIDTLIFFLKKRSKNFAKDRQSISNEIYDERKIKEHDYIDINRLLKLFCLYRNLPLDKYKKFIIEDEFEKELKDTDIFNTYKIKKISKEKIREIEKEKFYYFLLMFKQGKNYNDNLWYEYQKVVISKAPSKTDDLKEYIGYKYSDRRGYEGVEILFDENGNPKTKLYNEDDYDDIKKVNSYIRKNYSGIIINDIENELLSYLKIVDLPDLFDFDNYKFINKLNIFEQVVIKTKYETKRLINLLNDVKITTKIEKDLWKKTGKTPIISQEKENEISGYIDNVVEIDTLPIIIFGDHSCAVKYIDYNFVRGADGVVLLKPNKELKPKYFYFLLKYLIQDKIPNKDKYERHFKYLKDIKIPIPPNDIQKNIIAEINKILQRKEDIRKILDVFDKYL